MTSHFEAEIGLKGLRTRVFIAIKSTDRISVLAHPTRQQAFVKVAGSFLRIIYFEV